MTNEIALTDKALAFAKNLAGGMNKTAAARAAGYAYPKQEAQRLMEDEKVLAFIQREIVRKVQTEGQAIAFNFLLDTVTNEKAPMGARVECARIITTKGPLNEHAIKAAVDHANDRPLNEKSVEELEAFIKGGQAALEKIKEKRALEGESVPVSAQPLEAIPHNPLKEE